MSIKVVDEVPGLAGKKTYNDMIREDFNEAIKNHIEKFEFEGDYNYKTLAQSARIEGGKLFNRTIFNKAKKQAMKILEEEFGKTCVIFDWDYRSRYITITSRKMPDRIHVYATIDYEYGENILNIVLEQERAKQKERELRRKEYEERRR